MKKLEELWFNGEPIGYGYKQTAAIREISECKAMLNFVDGRKMPCTLRSVSLGGRQLGFRKFDESGKTLDFHLESFGDDETAKLLNS